jgi:cytochrome c553
MVGHFVSRYECADMRSITAPVSAARALATFLIRADDAAAPHAAALKEKLEVCAGCGGGWRFENEGVPSLAGQPDFFTEDQLLYFRGETRKNKEMNPVAQDLTDDDIRDLGAYYASLPGAPASTDADPDPALTKQGARLVTSKVACRAAMRTL